MMNCSEFANCAHCGEPLRFVAGRVSSWRVGERYACNEFCAEGVEYQAPVQNAALNDAAAAGLAHVPEKWEPVFRKGHAPINESRVHPDSTQSGCTLAWA